MARAQFKVKQGISVADDNSAGGYQLVPVGTVVAFAGSSAPEGWLMCDGSAVVRTTYANLWAVLGTTYGAGDGSTTFNLPDAMGRNIIGAGSGSGLTARTISTKSGAESVVIESGNLPLHTHTLSAHTHTSAAHSHTSAAHSHTSAAHSHTLGGHTHGLGGHTHGGPSHAHNIPRGLIATAGTNRAVVSTQDNQPTINTGSAGIGSTGGPSGGSDGPSGGSDSTTPADTGSTTPGNTGSTTPAATGSPNSDVTGNGGFANTALTLMNPFLVLNYIIKY